METRRVLLYVRQRNTVKIWEELCKTNANAGNMVKLCMSFKGTLFCNNDLDQNSVSFMHMLCLNCVASFKYCRRSCGNTNSTTKYDGRMAQGKTICPPQFVAEA